MRRMSSSAISGRARTASQAHLTFAGRTTRANPAPEGGSARGVCACIGIALPRTPSARRPKKASRLFVSQSRVLAHATSTAMGLRSLPKQVRPLTIDSNKIVPPPQNGSSSRCPGKVPTTCAQRLGAVVLDSCGTCASLRLTSPAHFSASARSFVSCGSPSDDSAPCHSSALVFSPGRRVGLRRCGSRCSLS